MKLFDNYFPYERPDQMLRDLFDSKSNVDNHDRLVLIHRIFDYLGSKAEKMLTTTNENKFVKILKIVNEIHKFNEQIKWGQGLKILTPSQMLRRLPISLAQLKAGNNSEKLKNEIRQLLYSLYRSKKLTNRSIKVWLTLFKAWKQFL